MGCGHVNQNQRADCPNCGKKESAFMGSSRWDHTYSCCSDECGFELKEKLETLRDSKEYKKLIAHKRDTEDKLRDLEESIIKGDKKAQPHKYDWESW